MYEFLQYTVKDVMTTSPMTATPETPLQILDEIFSTHDFNGIPILDEQKHLVGMVTKYDVLKAFRLTTDTLVPHYDMIIQKPAKAIMTTDLQTVSSDWPLTRLVQFLIEMRHKSFPVVDDNQLVGIVSREDILRALLTATVHRVPR